MKKNNQLGLLALIKRSRPINLITGPIIYIMILPLLFLDLFVSFFQWSCFPIYGIKKFSRKEFFIFDRHELLYLDLISKFHCTYCAYGVGVIAYVEAIISATEAYFCPIKHKSPKKCSKTINCHYISFDEPDNFDFNQYLDKVRENNSKIDKI